MGNTGNWNQLPLPQLQSRRLASRPDKPNLLKFSSLRQHPTQLLSLSLFSPHFTLLKFKTPDGLYDNYGSGFIFCSTAQHHLILTCYHNISQQKTSSHEVQLNSLYTNFRAETIDGEVRSVSAIFSRPGEKVYGADIGLFAMRREKGQPELEVPVVDAPSTQYNLPVCIFGFAEHTVESLEGEQRQASFYRHDNWKFMEIKHDVATKFGFSGAPIFVYNNSQMRYEIIGVHTRTDGRSNYGVKIDKTIKDWIQEQIEKLKPKEYQKFDEIVDVPVGSEKPDEEFRSSGKVQMALKIPQYIEIVKMMDTAITDQTVKFLYQNFKRIRILKLNKTKITNKGLILALQLPQLYDLSASQTFINTQFLALLPSTSPCSPKPLHHLNLGNLFQTPTPDLQLSLFNLLTLFPLLHTLTIGYKKPNKQLRLHLSICLENTLKQVEREVQKSQEEVNRITETMQRYCEREEMSREVVRLEARKEELRQIMQKRALRFLQQREDGLYKQEIELKVAQKEQEDKEPKEFIKEVDIFIEKGSILGKKQAIQTLKDTFAGNLALERLDFQCMKGGVPCIQ